MIYISKIPPTPDNTETIETYQDNPNLGETCGIPPAGSAASGQCAEVGTGTMTLTGSSGLVFLGSLITDASKNLIPFSRIGDEVHLFPEQATTASLPTWNQSGWTIPVSTSAITNTWTFTIPGSASAALIDTWGWTNGTSAINIQILDPFGMSGSTNMWPQVFIPTITNAQPLPHTQLRIQLRGGDTNGTIVGWAPAGVASGSQAALNIALKGYVENIRQVGW